MKTEKKELKKLINAVKHAATTYKEVSTNYENDHVEHFIHDLTKNHKVFVEKVENSYNITDDLPVKNQLQPGVVFTKGSALDILLLAKDIEKQILKLTRDAVHGCDRTDKQMLCQQLEFTEKAVFKADKLLERYE